MNPAEIFRYSSIGPIDGRYREKTHKLSPYFSEYAFMRQKVYVEISYLVSITRFLCPEKWSMEEYDLLWNIFKEFSLEDATSITEIERRTLHDTKAIEIFLRKKIGELSGVSHKAALFEFIHFGLTSQDAVGFSYYSSLLGSRSTLLSGISNLVYNIEFFLSTIPPNVLMLSFTHGQSATPTTVQNFFKSYLERLLKQREKISEHQFSLKFSGATGGMNAHLYASPEKDWKEYMDDFVLTLGFVRENSAKQVGSNETMVEYFSLLRNLNNILLDLSNNLWLLVLKGYIVLKREKDSVGSSTMPHKVNPIEVENAEGNILISNAFFEVFISKFQISRMQRDLSDSTMMRNIGVSLSHHLLAVDSLSNFFKKIGMNFVLINEELSRNHEVVLEGLQTYLRYLGYPDSYDSIKNFFDLNLGKITPELIESFIDALDLSLCQNLEDNNLYPEIRLKLKSLTPQTYFPLQY